MLNILYYKYVHIENVEVFRDEHFELCQKLSLKGKILVAAEGINGCVTGEETSIQEYMKTLRADPRFADMEFKKGATTDHNFKKLVVKVRKEIVSSGLNIDMNNKAPYIEPQEFKAVLDRKEEVILFDVRNDYESDIGHFNGAIPMDTETFRELPEIVERMKHLKDKNIITYCTGGIRCEKASAYLREQGFTKVRQLHGGIIRYGEECGNDHWQGKCFVFDTRGAIDIDPHKQNQPITHCVLCSLPCEQYHNCAFVKCDKRFLACDKCVSVLEHCCSKDCRHKARNETKKSECMCSMKPLTP